MNILRAVWFSLLQYDANEKMSMLTFFISLTPYDYCKDGDLHVACAPLSY